MVPCWLKQRRLRCVCTYVCVYCVCASVYCVCGVNKVRDFSEGTVEQYEYKTLYVYVSL